MSWMFSRRYEFRYMLNHSRLQAVLSAMAPYTEPDESFHSSIRSLYLDTPDFRRIPRSLEGPVYPEKVRIRSYGREGEQDQVFVELEKKYRHVVYKRRLTMPQRTAMR